MTGYYCIIMSGNIFLSYIYIYIYDRNIFTNCFTVCNCTTTKLLRVQKKNRCESFLPSLLLPIKLPRTETNIMLKKMRGDPTTRGTQFPTALARECRAKMWSTPRYCHWYIGLMPRYCHGYIGLMPRYCHGYIGLMPRYCHGYIGLMPRYCHGYICLMPRLYPP